MSEKSDTVSAMTPADPIRRVLVTGGAGFLGRALLRELAKQDLDEIRILDRTALDGPPAEGVVSIVGDVCDGEAVRDACRGVDVVIHGASMVDWGTATPGQLAAVNVGGTETVLDASRKEGVRGVVYTSSMDVVCGTRPVVRADETLPYPERFTNEYSRTKALAEQVALAAHGADLEVCSLRPCGMFGEGDPYHVANVLKVVQQGGLPFRIGDGRSAFQHVYVGNVAHAHVLAMNALLDPGSPVGGRAYFITDDSPAVDFLEFMEPILNELGYSLPPPTRRVPYPVVFTLGAILEALAFACRPVWRFAPALTRSSVRFVCHEHTFDGSRAQRDFGYRPIYGEAEAIERTVAWFRQNGDAAGEGDARS